MNYFSKNLKYLREKKGISKSELSKKINVNQSTLTRWENEDMGATIDNALDVAIFFDVSMADLVGRDLHTSENNKTVSVAEFKSIIKDLLSRSTISTKDKNIIIAIVNNLEEE